MVSKNVSNLDFDLGFKSLFYGGRFENIQWTPKVWAGPVSGYRVVLVLVNRSGVKDSITAHWDDIGLHSDTAVTVRDLWEHHTLPKKFVNNITTTVDTHSCKMYI